MDDEPLPFPVRCPDQVPGHEPMVQDPDRGGDPDTACMIMLRQAVQDQPVERNFREIEKLLDQALSTANTLTSELSPPVLYELGFVPAVRWLSAVECACS